MMLTELIAFITSWRALVMVLVVFGLAPGFALRLISLAFHREDPRRTEMVAELHAVPWLERPLWVAQQLEVAICEGLRDRIAWAAMGRVYERWRLESGVKLHGDHPDTFDIPTDVEKREIQPGDTVKAIFRLTLSRDSWGERMWLEVVEVKRDRLRCRLTNQPVGFPRLDHGDVVSLKLDHVIDIIWAAEDEQEQQRVIVDSECRSLDD